MISDEVSPGFKLVFKTSMDGDCMDSLGSLLSGLTVRALKKFLFLPSLNLPHSSLCLLPLVFPLYSPIKSLSS